MGLPRDRLIQRLKEALCVRYRGAMPHYLISWLYEQSLENPALECSLELAIGEDGKHSEVLYLQQMKSKGLDYIKGYLIPEQIMYSELADDDGLLYSMYCSISMAVDKVFTLFNILEEQSMLGFPLEDLFKLDDEEVDEIFSYIETSDKFTLPPSPGPAGDPDFLMRATLERIGSTKEEQEAIDEYPTMIYHLLENGLRDGELLAGVMDQFRVYLDRIDFEQLWVLLYEEYDGMISEPQEFDLRSYACQVSKSCLAMLADPTGNTFLPIKILESIDYVYSFELSKMSENQKKKFRRARARAEKFESPSKDFGLAVFAIDD